VHGAPATAVESWTVQGSKRSKIQRAAWTLLRSEEPRELRDSVTAGEQPIPRTAQVVETERREERYMGWRQSLQGIDDSGQQPGERHSSYIRGGCAPPALQAAVNKIHSLISSDSNATPCLVTVSPLPSDPLRSKPCAILTLASHPFCRGNTSKLTQGLGLGFRV
jgi:hypothetical protein